MEAPITMGINHKPAPELLVPYWIDGVGRQWESALLHTQAAHDQGVNAAKIAHLARWRESTMFTEAEPAALAYCEGLTDYDLPGFPPLHAALARHFSQKQVAEIAAIVINMNLWTRLKLAQGAVPVTE
jgi:alkylhydroperoxidase family enzyme